MSKKKKAGKPMFPMFPMTDAPEWDWDWNWDGFQDKSNKKSKEFKADMKSYWEKAIEMQTSSIDGSKKQFNQFRDYMNDMMDDFVELLPDEIPWMPSWAKAPKSFRKTMKEWDEMANEYFSEQYDLWTDFAIKSQKKACDQIPNAPEDAEENDDVVEAEVVEEPKQAKQAAAKSAATKQSAAKSTAAKETKTAAAKTTAAKETKTAAAKDAKEAK